MFPPGNNKGISEKANEGFFMKDATMDQVKVRCAYHYFFAAKVFFLFANDIFLCRFFFIVDFC